MKCVAPVRVAAVYALSSIVIGPAIGSERLRTNLCGGAWLGRPFEWDELQQFVQLTTIPLMIVGIGIAAWLVAARARLSRTTLIVFIPSTLLMICGYAFVLVVSEVTELQSCFL
jgi:hypothetical protein